jgi:dTDP-glucose pyrophosphorylase
MPDQGMTTRAVVLARGLGTRMRDPDPAVPLPDEQRRAADAGHKAMMPINGRPFLDYALGSLADAGVPEIALVVAPDHAALRAHYAAAPPVRLRLAFVVQDAASGTANAVRAAEAWTRGEAFLALNADNLYPVPALRDLAALDGPGLLAFDADDLIRSSGIPAERIRAFAAAAIDRDGYLTEIIEKPREASAPVAPGFSRKISMNCWRFDARIFDACRDVPKSPRGEYELPEAVALAMARGVRVKAVPARGPVLDLSRRADAADVARRLAGIVPCL